MNTGGGGYQPAPTTVVVMPTRRSFAPYYMRQGVRVGGLALGIPCVVCMLMFGGFFVFSGTIALATANYDDDFWDKFDRSHDPAQVVGGIMLTAGLILLVAGIGVCCYAKEKYKTFDGTGHTNPGRIITPSPGLTVPGQQTANPGQPVVSPGQPAYPGQPAVYPGQPGVPYGQPAPGGVPGQPGGMAVTYQYTPPGQAVPPPQVPTSTDPTGYPTAPGGYPTGPAGYPTAPAGYPTAPAGYPTAPAGYPTAPTGYPGAPTGYPGAPASYPTDPQPPATDYPVKGDQPPPYAP